MHYFANSIWQVHFYTYPLEQFGLSNPNVVFQSTDCHTTASGRIRTIVRRGDVGGGGGMSKL